MLLKKIMFGLAICLASCSLYVTMPPQAVRFAQPVTHERREVDYNTCTYQEAIEAVQDISDVIDYFAETEFSYDYEKLETPIENMKNNSFRVLHTTQKGVCLDQVMVMCALLSNDGFPPYALHLFDEIKSTEDSENSLYNYAHAVYLYRTQAGYYALNKKYANQDYFELGPYEDIETLTEALGYRRYAVMNFDQNYTREEWVHGGPEVDLFKICMLPQYERIEREEMTSSRLWNE